MLTNVCLAGVALACAMHAGEARFEVATVKPSGPESATRRFLIEGRRFATFPHLARRFGSIRLWSASASDL
jgi:hypothetical protein